MLKRIHVNKHHIAANRKDGGNRPIYTVKTYEGNYYGHEVRVCGESTLVNGQDNPLSCGAVAWAETHARVVAFDEWGHKFVLD